MISLMLLPQDEVIKDLVQAMGFDTEVVLGGLDQGMHNVGKIAIHDTTKHNNGSMDL